MGASMDIFGVLSGRIAVAADQEANLVVTWNESMTFQTWFESAPGLFEEKGIFTHKRPVEGLEEAKRMAREWIEAFRMEIGL